MLTKKKKKKILKPLNLTLILIYLMAIKTYYARIFIANRKCGKDINNVIFLTASEIIGYRAVDIT